MFFGHRQIVIMTGPTMTGKSFLSERIKTEAEKAGLRVSVVSSDSIREELIGEGLDKYDRRMLEVSEQAFAELDMRVRSLASFPVSKDLIIVDSTALDDSFREKMRTIAKEKGYGVSLVVINLPWAEHMEMAGVGRRKVASEMAKKARSALGHIKKREWDNIFKIQSAEQARNEEITFPDVELLKKCRLPDGQWAFIGDVHECTDSLDALIERLPAGTKPILCGDWIDKGGNPEKMISWIERESPVLILGNHENYIWKRLSGTEINMPISEENDLFPSLALIESQNLKERFIALCEKALPFVEVAGNKIRETIYAMHAPCQKMHIGSLREEGVKAQRNWRVQGKSMSEIAAEMLSFAEDTPRNGPAIVSGHVMTEGKKRYSGQRYWLDGGCVCGGELIAMVTTVTGTKVYSVPSKEVSMKKEQFVVLNDPLDSPEPNLEWDEERTVSRFLADGGVFMSPTVAPPAPQNGKLESLESALEVYAKKKAKVVIQPKYMGSRFQVKLFKNNPEKSFGLTRGGRKIAYGDKGREWFTRLINRECLNFSKMTWWTSNIWLDCELLPWSLLGEDLIEKDFRRYHASASAEVSALVNDPVFMGFELAREMKLEQVEKGLESFGRQLELYGSSGDPEIKPFDILKIDDKVCTLSPEEAFGKISSDEQLVIEPWTEEGMEKARQFFSKMVFARNEEGVVIKPLSWERGMPPATKVRNEDYLTIIYGGDWKLHEKELCSRKKVKSKRELSEKQFIISRAMLAAETEDELRGLAARFIASEREGARIDPRL